MEEPMRLKKMQRRREYWRLGGRPRCPGGRKRWCTVVLSALGEGMVDIGAGVGMDMVPRGGEVNTGDSEEDLDALGVKKDGWTSPIAEGISWSREAICEIEPVGDLPRE